MADIHASSDEELQEEMPLSRIFLLRRYRRPLQASQGKIWAK